MTTSILDSRLLAFQEEHVYDLTWSVERMGLYPVAAILTPGLLASLCNGRVGARHAIVALGITFGYVVARAFVLDLWILSAGLDAVAWQPSSVVLSFAPLPIVIYWALRPQEVGVNPIRVGVVIALVALWGARLTWNWTRGWTGLDHEDWRYVDIKEKTGALYWPVSFLGIHLLPTLWVFLALLVTWTFSNT